MNRCVNPGDILTYECTVTCMAAGSTAWTGSAFDCLASNNHIVLLHIRFLHDRRTCNNGSIVARGLSVEDSNCTSQLNVTVTPGIAGKTITCASDNGRHIKHLFFWTIPTVIGLSLATLTNFM